MKPIQSAVISTLLLFSCMFNQAILGQAQQNIATNTNAIVPPLVNFSGTLTEPNGRPLPGTVAVTFSLYAEQTGGAALWMETQSLQPDLQGRYTVTLGSTSSNGLPAEIFVAGQAHWLGVQAQGQEEQARVLLVSAPYALKAGDAQTLGGLPASAFVLVAAPSTGATAVSSDEVSTSVPASAPPPSSSDVTTTGGTVGTLPLFNTTTNIQNSILTQTGTTAVNIAGKLNLPASGTATSAAGKNSQAHTFAASAYNSSTSAAVTQTFQLQAEPAGNDTASPSGTLNVLFGSGTSTPGETGLKISNKGLITFATGQKFPGTGAGTITGVTAGSDLTGGGSSGKVTLNLDTAKVPLLASANTFTANQTVNGSLTAQVGVFSGSSSFTGLDVVNNGSGQGITVSSTTDAVVATSSESDAGYFQSSADGYGIYSEADSDAFLNASVAGFEEGATQTNIGVWGFAASPIGIGTYGEVYGASLEGSAYPGTAAIGLWGDSSGDPGTVDGVGVLATVDYGLAVIALNNTSGGSTAWLENDESMDRTSPVLTTDGGSTNLRCVIDVGANLTCAGTISDAVPINSGAKKVGVYGVASPENWFEDAGNGQLSGGVAVVNLDETFAQTVNTGVDYHVFLTPNGDCKGLYVSHKSATSFEVHELGGGTSSIAFDYRIMAKRRGFEAVRLEDRTKALSAQGPKKPPAGAQKPTPDQVRKTHMQKTAELRKTASVQGKNAAK